MSKDIKEEIVEAIEEFSEDDLIMAHFGSEKDYEMLKRGEMLVERQEAREEGKKEGLIAGKIETAKNMLKENFDIHLISKVTGLTIETINNLK